MENLKSLIAKYLTDAYTVSKPYAIGFAAGLILGLLL